MQRRSPLSISRRNHTITFSSTPTLRHTHTSISHILLTGNLVPQLIPLHILSLGRIKHGCTKAILQFPLPHSITRVPQMIRSSSCVVGVQLLNSMLKQLLQCLEISHQPPKLQFFLVSRDQAVLQGAITSQEFHNNPQM
jgi:hypothetical protein